MGCSWIPRRLMLPLLTILLVLTLFGSFGVVFAGPGGGEEPVPISPPTGTSAYAGDASSFLGLVLCIANAVLL